MKRCLILLLLAFGINVLATANERLVPVIAILEDYADALTDENSHRQRVVYESKIRGVFVKEAAGWKTLCALGEFGKAEQCSGENVRPFAKLYGFQGGQRFAIETNGMLNSESGSGVGWLNAGYIGIEQEGDRLLKYAGWNHYPAYRPIALTNRKQRIVDPEMWQPTEERDDLPDNAWKRLASMIADADMCVVGEPRAQRKVKVPWKNTHLAFRNQFGTGHGLRLVQVRLSPAFIVDCKLQGGEVVQMPSTHPEFWLTIAPGREPVIHVLKSLVGFDKLELIAFGDFDGDGRTEGLFLLGGYNKGGYVLFHDDMTKRAMFAWGYH